MRAAGGLILSELSLGSPATQCRLLHGGATHWRRRLTPLGGVSLFECPQSPFQDAPMLPARVCAAHRKAPHGSGCAVPKPGAVGATFPRNRTSWTR
jgi:hypothetical protein